MPDQPERKQKPADHQGGPKPTQDRQAAPRFDIPQQGPAHLPSAPAPKAKDTGTSRTASSPELRRSSAANTQQRTSITPGDDMRNWLNRIDRSQVAPDEDDVRPQEPETANLPAIVGHDVARISNDLADTANVNPEWHQLTNMPGFKDAAIRKIGKDIFKMFTNTPHEDILTIANLQGSGNPNSENEIRAVVGWLQQNADELPESELDYGHVIPGYGNQVRVKEFRTENTRFHVVRDPMGHYIYAYPEADAVQHGDGEPTHDEFGAPLLPSTQKRLREETDMSKFSTISEQIRYFTSKLENLQEQVVEETLNWELLESVLDESSLSKMIGNTAGGQSLVRYLHRQHQLGNAANYEEVPERLHAQSIKADKDNFAIIVGTNGVAGVKPLAADWDRSRTPERDNTMRYVLVWATGDQGAESEIQKFRLGRRDATGGASGLEGGAPNLFQVLRDRIGSTVSVYRAVKAVERSKMATRAGYKQEAIPTDEQIGAKLKPVLSKLLQQTVGQLGPRIQRLAQAGNYDAVEKLTRAGKKIQAMATALDSPNPQWTGWNSPLSTYNGLIQQGVREITQSMDKDGQTQFKINLVQGQAKELGELLNFVRSRLFSISE